MLKYELANTEGVFRGKDNAIIVDLLQNGVIFDFHDRIRRIPSFELETSKKTNKIDLKETVIHRIALIA